MKKQIKKINIFIAIFAIMIISGSIFAIATKYTPGQTLDPTCSPGEENCTVEIPDIGKFVNGTNTVDAVYTGGNVGIGTIDPQLSLAIGDSDTGIHQDGDGVLELWTNNQDRLHITDNGNVGIGTATPTQKLAVEGNIISSGVGRFDGGVQVDGKEVINLDGYVHTAQSPNNDHYGYFAVKKADGTRGGYFGYGNGSSSLTLNMDAASALDITGGNVFMSGRLGIGTTAPGTRLHINDSTDVQGNSSANGVLMIGPSGGQHLSFDNNEIMSKNGDGLASLSFQLQGGTSIFGGNVTSYGSLNASGSVRAGNGWFTSGKRSNFHLILQGDRNMVLYDDGAAVWSSGTGVSDIRYKKEIKDKGNMLDFINGLSIIDYKYKGNLDDGKRHIGVIAQELLDYEDFYYHDKKADRYVVHYDKLSILGIKGVQDLKKEKDLEISELQKDIEVLKAENTEKDQQISNILKRLESLEK